MSIILHLENASSIKKIFKNNNNNVFDKIKKALLKG